MGHLTSKKVAVFSEPFAIPEFAATLPAGEYEAETELVFPRARKETEASQASVLVSILAAENEGMPSRPDARLAVQSRPVVEPI